MKTIQTAKGDLLATIQIDIDKADYAEDVKKELKNYQHKAVLPGFRQGKVPFGMIEKMYGATVTFDKLNKKVSEALNNHILENKLDVIGYPLSDPDKQQPTDPETQETMSFFFEVGLKPEIKVELGKIAINDYNIKASDKEIDETIKRIQEGNKKDDKLPELNEELFKMIFPAKDIKDVDTFRKEIATEMERQYVVEAERMFLNNAIDKLVSEIKFDMPDAFLKRWIVANSDGKISAEDVEKNYDNMYSKTFRWQLIEETIAKANPELVLDVLAREYHLEEFFVELSRFVVFLVAFLDALDCLVDFFVGSLDVVVVDGDLGEVDFDFRLQADFKEETHCLLSLRIGRLLLVGIRQRVTYHVELVLEDMVVESLGNLLVQLVECDCCAIHLFYHSEWDFTLTEARKHCFMLIIL